MFNDPRILSASQDQGNSWAAQEAEKFRKRVAAQKKDIELKLWLDDMDSE